MKKVALIVVLSIVAALVAIPAGAVAPVRPAGPAPPVGECCLCTLAYTGTNFSWACNCQLDKGSLYCETDRVGCTNVGTCY